ncbi:urea carboxylase-associated family protein [Halomonas sp. V046]|uniref:urea carboxylase-associated family protein n=1 Tax=Halomonas sp. V046 TaxID=3459611 RepID=UPI0040447599
MSKVPAAYQATRGSPLEVDTRFYDALTQRGAAGARHLVASHRVPVRQGLAWSVKAGQVFRVSIVEGAQVGDFNMWSLHDPRERMWASRTRQLQRAHVSTYDRLWSTLPFLRPMATIIDDTLAGYGVDGEGGRVHDLLGTRCDPYVNRLLTGEDFDFHCHSNLVRAVAPWGLTEFDVHDVLNIFQCTGLNDDDRYFMKACPARRGDYLEFFAEIDLLCALSCCPGGDLSVDLWGPGAKDPLQTCHPLGVEVFAIEKACLEGWVSPERAAYGGAHGRRDPSIDWAEVKRHGA